MAAFTAGAAGSKYCATQGEVLAGRMDVSFIDCIAAAADDRFVIKDGDALLVADHKAAASGTVQIGVFAAISNLTLTTLTAGAQVLVRKASIRTTLER